MKMFLSKNIILFFLILGLFFSCKEKQPKEVAEIDSVLQNNFDNNTQSNHFTYDTNQFYLPTNPIDSIGNRYIVNAKNICDSLLKDFFGSKLFTKYIHFDNELSYGNLTNKDGEIEIYNFNEMVNYKPHLYHLYYHLIYESDTIHLVSLEKYKKSKFEINAKQVLELSRYKSYLYNEFYISYKKAKQIALENGIESDMEIKLETNIHLPGSGPLTYSWYASPKKWSETPKKTILINVNNGHINEGSISLVSLE